MSNIENSGVANVTAAQASDEAFALWLPKRAGKDSWEKMEAALGIRRTGRLGGEMDSLCEVTAPAGWLVAESDSYFVRYLIDNEGRKRAKLFFKNYRADFTELT